jgi:hypothetical protein
MMIRAVKRSLLRRSEVLLSPSHGILGDRSRERAFNTTLNITGIAQAHLLHIYGRGCISYDIQHSHVFSRVELSLSEPFLILLIAFQQSFSFFTASNSTTSYILYHRPTSFRLR